MAVRCEMAIGSKSDRFFDPLRPERNVRRAGRSIRDRGSTPIRTIRSVSYAARISMDVMFSGTGADPARMFRAYFSMMKHQTTEFRKLINFN